MSTVLPTGTNLANIREAGEYFVINPSGLTAGSYYMEVTEGADASGNNYCFQRLVDLATGALQVRAEVEAGMSDWITLPMAGDDIVAAIDDELGSADWQTAGGGGGGITLEGVSTSGTPLELHAESAEVRYEVVTGATQAPETILLLDGAFSGQRVVITLATLTDAQDSVVFDMTNIRINTGGPTFAGGTNLTFGDASFEDPELLAVGDFIALEWNDSTGHWFVRDIDPAPPSV